MYEKTLMTYVTALMLIIGLMPFGFAVLLSVWVGGLATKVFAVLSIIAYVLYANEYIQDYKEFIKGFEA